MFFERKRLVRFENVEDIRRYGTISLPESLDPPSDERFTPWHLRTASPPSRWLNVRLDHFTARVRQADGEWVELPVEKSTVRHEMRTLRTMESPWSFVMRPQGIMPGDTVELHWKYMVPYDFNWPATSGWRQWEWPDNWARLTSWRVFFHGELPIARQTIEMRYNLLHGVVLSGTNYSTRFEQGNEVRLTWERRDLPGCIREVNARPAQDLPHINVQLVPEDFRYWRVDRLGGVARPQPYWLQVVRVREELAFWWVRVSRKRVPDRQNQYFRDFVRRVGGNDPSAVRRMQHIHDHIATDFEYRHDKAWYLDQDRKLPRYGNQVKEGYLRDISRYDLYAKLLGGLRLPYSTAYLLDKRIGAMTDLYLTPLWDNEFLFGVRDGERILWMHPKRSRHGLLAGELPFYWEGSGALLVDLELMMEELPPPPRFIDLPVIDPSANVRGTEWVVHLKEEDESAAADVRVFLSGQFSTLCRPVYLGGKVDSTVHAGYGHRPWDGEGTELTGFHVDGPETAPPYRTRVEATVTMDKRLVKWDDGTVTVDLADFLHHVVPEGFDADTRQLPFHWDFRQQDRIRVEFLFQRPMRIADEAACDRSHTTAASRLERTCRMAGDRKLVVESRLSIDAEREDPGDHHVLERLLADALGKDAVVVLETQRGD